MRRSNCSHNYGELLIATLLSAPCLAPICAKSSAKLQKALRIPGAGSVVPGRNHPDLFVRKVKVPARPYLGISADDAADVLEALAGWLQARQRRLPGPKR